MDKNLLFKATLPERDVEIEGIGTIKIRSLSRAQAIDVADAKGAAAMERLILHHGMVDPAMSVADVKRWQEASPAMGPANQVLEAITELSGMNTDAEKEAVQRFPSLP